MGRRRGRRRAPFKLKLRTDTMSSIAAILSFAVGAIVMVSFTRRTPTLRLMSETIFQYAGWTALLLPYFFITGGLMLTQLKWRITRPNVFVGGLLLTASLAGFSKAGIAGQHMWVNIAALVSPPGAGIMLIGIAAIGFIIMTETPLDQILLRIVAIFSSLKTSGGRIKRGADTWSSASAIAGGDPERSKRSVRGLDAPSPGRGTAQDSPDQSRNNEKSDDTSDLPSTEVLTNVPGASGSVWKYPPLSLLSDSAGGKADRGDVKKNADQIEQTLDSFGVKANVSEVNRGPAVTQYALTIALGTKLAKITTLQNDLALALAAPTGQIRIEAPIPGRNLVGIEVPNRAPEFVSLKAMLTNKALKRHPSKLAVGLGLNVAGDPVIADLADMPHVLIAGATGSGKSVCINTFLCTILFRCSPEDVKLILVDPKRVELTGYNGIPHLLTPVIVDPAQVVSALKWALKEMERRYKIFSEVGVRNIASYNEQSGFQAMPYLLVVIDELADIMLYAPNDVEDAVTRLAQMARATGIHLIVSTQRPSTDVITGLIKANIPCRIAFNVTSMVDSRVILDTPGAEKLLGRGDMLYIPPTQAKPTRIQGAFVSDREIESLITYLRQQGVVPQYNEAVTEKYQPGKSTAGGLVDGQGKDVDELFEGATKLVVQHQSASASFLQRRLSIGYARAARIIDQLQLHGVVGPADGAKPREILMKRTDGVPARMKDHPRAP